MGLLDFFGSPAGMGLLSAAAGGLAGARRGTPWNNVGRGAVSGLTGYANAQGQIRADEENAFQRQYRQMQMEQMQRQAADQQKMRESLQGLYKPAGTQPFQADNPFGENLGKLESNTPASFAGRDVDPVMAAVLPYAQPEDILKMFSPNVQDKTAEQRNWEFAQGLPEDQRSQFFARSGGTSTPASIAEWAAYQQMGPAERAQYIEMKRSPQVMNLGGSMAVRAPGGGVREAYTVSPKITDTPGYIGAQEAAKQAASVGVKTQAERGEKAYQAQTNAGSIDDLANEANRLLNDASSGKADAMISSGKSVLGISDKKTQADASLKVISGQLVGKVPRFEGPQSDADRLLYEQMAGRVGDPNVPTEDRRAALGTMRRMHSKYASGLGGAPKQKPQTKVKKYNPATGRIE